MWLGHLNRYGEGSPPLALWTLREMVGIAPVVISDVSSDVPTSGTVLVEYSDFVRAHSSFSFPVLSSDRRERQAVEHRKQASREENARWTQGM